MTTVQLLFLCLYVLMLVSYFFAETSGNFPRRAVNKIVLAAMFLLCGIVAYLHIGNMDGRLIILLGLVFAFLGDITLLWDMKKAGFLFGAASLLFLVGEIGLLIRCRVPFRWIFPVLLLAGSLFGFMMLMNSIGKIPFVEKGGKKYAVYLAVITLCGSQGFVLFIQAGCASVMLFGLGLCCIMASDYFLTVDTYYEHKNWILRTNSGLYFIGVLLVACSLGLPLV